MSKRLYKFAENFMKIVAVIFSGLIFFSAFFLTAYNYDLTGHFFDIKTENHLFSFAAMIIIGALGWLLYRALKKDFDKRLKIMLIAVIGWYFLACEYMAFFGRSMPNSDSWTVYAMSKQLAAGDLSIIDPTGSYMSYYPQQIGICAFLSVIIRVIHILPVSIEEFHFIIAFYGVMECVTIFAIYKAVDNIFNLKEINFCFLYISIFNVPYIMYSSYLYGEIPALMFFSLGALILSRLFNEKGKNTINIILSTIFFGLSVWTRKNSLILIIAVLIILVFELIRRKKKEILIAALAIGIVAFSMLPVTVRYYELKSGSTLSKGVTAMSYFAMGLLDVSDEGIINPGWYTAFNINTYEEAKGDTRVANEIAKEEIRERLASYKENPGEFWSFVSGKFLTQWVDGTYFSRESTHVYYGARSSFLMNLYEGNLGSYYIDFCSAIQTIYFFGAFLWAIFSLNKENKDNLWKSFAFIGVFGGFLFHMLWEANSRYIITYACLIIPYSAAGYAEFFKRIKRK